MSALGFNGTLVWDNGDLRVEVRDGQVVLSIKVPGRKPCEAVLDPGDTDRVRHLLRVAADVAENERSEWT